MRNVLTVLSLIFVLHLAHAQEVVAPLDDKINESSGLICLGDSLFITLNDSGNKNELYLVNSKGKTVNTCTIKYAKNTDWEDLCLVDDTMVYIADYGNNSNKRKDLKVYIVPLKDILKSTSAQADSISFKYPDQTQFPPNDANKYYDAESLCYFNNQLWIFTKNRCKPFNGISKVYSLPKKAGNYTATQHTSLKLKATNWMEECVTSATISQEHLFVLTYNKIYVYQIVNGNLLWKKTIYLVRFGMWEAIDVNNKNIYLTEEKNISLPQLYKLRWR